MVKFIDSFITLTNCSVVSKVVVRIFLPSPETFSGLPYFHFIALVGLSLDSQMTIFLGDISLISDSYHSARLFPSTEEQSGMRENTVTTPGRRVPLTSPPQSCRSKNHLGNEFALCTSVTLKPLGSVQWWTQSILANHSHAF